MWGLFGGGGFFDEGVSRLVGLYYYYYYDGDGEDEHETGVGEERQGFT